MNKFIGVFGLVAVAMVQPVWAEEPDQVVIDAKSERVLVNACQFLRSARTYAVDVAVDYQDVLLDGTRVTYHRDDALVMARPDRLRLEVSDDQGQRDIYINAEGMVIYRPHRQTYAKIDHTGTLDQRIAQAEKNGMSFPLADMLTGHPCQDMVEHMSEAAHAGKHYLDGQLVDHLIVKADQVDVQLWVEADDTPLIRKVVITYRELEGQPQYQAQLSNWAINLKLDDDLFVFTPPAGAKAIPLLRAGLAMGGK